MNQTYLPIFNLNGSEEINITYSEKNGIIEICSYIIAALGISVNILTIIVLSSEANLRNKPINTFSIHQVSDIHCIIH